MANLKAGMIGLGMMGRHHCRVLRNLDGVDLVAVADPMGDKHGVASGFEIGSSVEDIIAAGVDYCVVATPTKFHEEVGLRLAEAGIHTLIEKPLSQDTSSCQRLADAFENAGLIGGVGHIERYNASLQQARARIENGDLGRVVQVATRRQSTFPTRISDVGVVMDLGTHDLDLTSWVVQSRYKQVSAVTATKSGRAHEDMVSLVGVLENGVIANNLVNWLSPLKERTTVITGEKGTFIADTLSSDLTYYANGIVETVWDDLAQFRGVIEGDVVRYAFTKREPLQVEHENFRDAVLGKPADIVTMAQGMANVRVAEAAIESAKTGKTVEL